MNVNEHFKQLVEGQRDEVIQSLDEDNTGYAPSTAICQHPFLNGLRRKKVITIFDSSSLRSIDKVKASTYLSQARQLHHACEAHVAKLLTMGNVITAAPSDDKKSPDGILFQWEESSFCQ